MIHFYFPEFLLLAIPFWFFLQKYRKLPLQTGWCLLVPVWILLNARHAAPNWTGWLLAIPVLFSAIAFYRVFDITQWLRLTLVVLLVFSLSGAEFNLSGKGIDIIVVADRSRSLPENALARIQELIQNIERNRGPDDRVAVVSFGQKPHTEHLLSKSSDFTNFSQTVAPDGSDLNEALQHALNLADTNRPTRVFVLSDGEYNGRSPLQAARRARELRVPVDYRLFERQKVGDTAVLELMLPEKIAPKEPFQFSTVIHSESNVAATVILKRNGKEISRTNRNLEAGLNRILFGDSIEESGTVQYTVEIETPDDPLLENNRGIGVLSVEGKPKLLVLNNDGREGRMVRELKKQGINVDVFQAGKFSLTLDRLDRYRAVILENVLADKFSYVTMNRLAQYVEDLGGGLMLTGGINSFGSGGYFKSPLDPILPVSMDLKEEHKKLRVALAVVLDRSGSMSVPVSGGVTKLDLANSGTVESIRLLSREDMMTVIAVDSSAHIIQPLSPVRNKDAMIQKVRRIESSGGGIYIDAALRAAVSELGKVGDFNTRHIILFADAQDSEQPGRYQKLIADASQEGITFSVIGLGTEQDSDAELLKDIAKRGKGRVMFTQDARDLPRLFSQDTMKLTRNMFLRKNSSHPRGFSAKRVGGPHLIGNLGRGAFPRSDGYNMSYIKPDAFPTVISDDEFKAPWSAYWYRGLGRVAAITIEVEGLYAGEFAKWAQYSSFLGVHARWLMGTGNPLDVFMESERSGQDAVIHVELDPESVDRYHAHPLKLSVIPPGIEREQSLPVTLSWTSPSQLEGRFRMEKLETYRTLLKEEAQQGKSTRSYRGPTISLPYSPEFVPRHDFPLGKTTLAEIAELSGGNARTDVLEVFRNPPRSASLSPLLPWLMVATLLVLLLEISGRRLALWERKTAIEKAPTETQTRSWLPDWKIAFPKRKKPEKAEAKTQLTEKTGETTESSRAPTTQQKPESSESMASMLEHAKSRARRRQGD